MAVTLQSAVPASASDINSQLSALLTSAAVASLDDTGWIRVTGSDRVRWLNGMVSNFVQQLAPGEGCYNFVLNAQGRILGDLTVFALDDSLLLETTDAGKLATWFDHYIIMDDVELAVLCNGRSERESADSDGYPFLNKSSDRVGILLAGPRSIPALQSLGFGVGQLPSLRVQCATWNNAPLDVVHAYGPTVPRIELWADASTIDTLTSALIAAGVTPVTPEAIEQLRILEGTPRYGTDIRNSETAKDLPQETAQTRALHFSKGCYLGQEIVERIRSRGNVHRTFHGFELTGALPISGTELTAESYPRPVGELTSVAAIDLPQRGTVQLALGYIRREALDRGLKLEYPGGIATPIALPYPIS